jgi:protein gp37
MFWSQVRLQAYLFISLIDVEAKLGCSHCYRWNSAARCSSMDVQQYSVIQSAVYCYNASTINVMIMRKDVAETAGTFY